MCHAVALAAFANPIDRAHAGTHRALDRAHLGTDLYLDADGRWLLDQHQPRPGAWLGTDPRTEPDGRVGVPGPPKSLRMAPTWAPTCALALPIEDRHRAALRSGVWLR